MVTEGLMVRITPFIKLTYSSRVPKSVRRVTIGIFRTLTRFKVKVKVKVEFEPRTFEP
jgi:hypothetical protein